jgi:hypothetical protein
MAAKKYISIVSGILTEIQATDSSAGAGDSGRIPALNASGVLAANIVNSVQSSAGAGDAAKVVALDSSGKIDTSMMPTGIGADTASITATEALSAGDLVNIYNSSGAKCRKADATTSGKEAHGFVLASVSSSATATVYFEGTDTGVSGLTPGVQYLSTTAGTATATPPSGSGNASQVVGFATSATTLNFSYSRPVILA